MSHRNKIIWLVPVLVTSFLLTACESWLPDAHRPDYIQGNVIKRDALDKVQVGMKKSDIKPILGNPLLKDPFHAQRWDYIYRFLPGRGEPIQSRVTLYFEGDVLIKIDDSDYVEPVSDDEEETEKEEEATSKPVDLD